MSVKRIGVLTSGGDAPGMNPCVRAVVRTALYRGLECYGIRRGWNGLITGDIVRLDEKSVSHTINRGGTILYTARSQEFMTEEGQRRAVSTCKFLGLDSIIAIGGGSVIDVAKVLAVAPTGSDTSAVFDSKQLKQEKELIILPTTCGTGSEVTNISIINRTCLGIKVGLVHDSLYARHAVLVPELLEKLLS